MIIKKMKLNHLYLIIKFVIVFIEDYTIYTVEVEEMVVNDKLKTK